MADGHLNKCKECAKTDVKANRKDKIDYYRTYDTERGNRQTLEDLQRYRLENPKKYAAHSAVASAVKYQKLLAEPCEVCGSLKTVAHHDDYNKPLIVRWLCQPHHVEWHQLNGEGANAH